MGKLVTWFKKMKKKHGVFTILFPMAILLLGTAITLLSFQLSGSNILGWLVGDQAFLTYLIIIGVALGLTAAYLAA
jgi:hypothetical protein